MNTRTYIDASTPIGTRVARLRPDAATRDDVYYGTVTDVFGSMYSVRYDGGGTATGPLWHRSFFVAEDEATPVPPMPIDELKPQYRELEAERQRNLPRAAWAHDYESPRGESDTSAPCAACGAPYGEWVHDA